MRIVSQNGDLISALERRMAARRAGPRQHAGAHGAPHTASFAEVNHYVGACLAGALLPPSVAMRKGAVTATQARIYDVRSRIQVNLAGLTGLPFEREKERERDADAQLCAGLHVAWRSSIQKRAWKRSAGSRATVHTDSRRPLLDYDGSLRACL